MNRAEFDRFTTACADLAVRAGASEWQLRYSDDEQPIIWMAYAKWARGGPADGHEEVAAGLGPGQAMFRLLEAVLDGGHCQHCRRPSGVLHPKEGPPAGTVTLFCWYTYRDEDGWRPGCARAAETRSS